MEGKEVWRPAGAQYHHYGDEPAATQRAYAVLVAWSLWRSKEDGWAERRSARKTWWAREFARLRGLVAALGSPGGGTGHPKSDGDIRDLVPDALA